MAGNGSKKITMSGDVVLKNRRTGLGGSRAITEYMEGVWGAAGGGQMQGHGGGAAPLAPRRSAHVLWHRLAAG